MKHHNDEKNLNQEERPKEEPKEPAAAPVSEESKAKEHLDQLLRLKAEFDNTKKRLERDKLEAIKFANEKLLIEILPVVDNFDRAMTSLSEGHDPEKVKQGLKIAQDELHQVLEEHGVQVIDALGKEFDPKFHEAVAVMETTDIKDGLVVDEIQRGYTLSGRLIRPSLVRIAKNQKSDDRRQKAEGSDQISDV